MNIGFRFLTYNFYITTQESNNLSPKNLESLQAKYKHLPNFISGIRLAIVPILLVFYPSTSMQSGRVFFATLFLIAALSDFLDGYIARSFQLQTKIGAILDQMADKFLVASCLILLAYTQSAHPFLLGIIICRDIAISGLRLLASSSGYELKVGSSGKLKTLFTMAAIFCLMMPGEFIGLNFKNAGDYFLIISIILSVYSAYLYVVEFQTHAYPQI